MFVLAADLVIAADTAKLIQVFVRRGLVPDGGVAYLLPRVVGMHKAKELIFFGDDLSAADAERLGIVNKVVPAAELQAAAKEWAERLANGPTKAIGWAKKLLHDASELSRDEPARRKKRCRGAQQPHRGLGRRRRVVPRAPRSRSGRAGERRAELIKDKTAVVGIGQTTLGKGLPDTELSLACQAVSLALDDAGIAPSEVDGLASYTMEPNREVDVARAVGLGDITFFSQVGFGGGAGCGVVGHAAMAVATGQCEVVVAWRARKRAERGEPAVGAGVGPPRRRPAVDAAVRDPPPGRRDRDADPPLHARVRRHPRPPRQRRDRVPQARGAQSRRRRWATSR